MARNPALWMIPVLFALSQPVAWADGAASPLKMRFDEKPAPAAPQAVEPTPAKVDLQLHTIVTSETNPSKFKQLKWKWREVHPAESAVAGLGIIAAGLNFGVPPASTPNMSASNPVDNTARHALMAPKDMQLTLSKVSDGILGVALAVPILIDAALVVGVGDRNPAYMGRMAALYANSLATAGFIVVLAKTFVAQPRPYMADCAPDSKEARCTAGDRYQNFFSGHATMTAVAAADMCEKHLHGHIYRNKGGDIAACVISAALSVAVGILRVSAEMHNISNVMLGWAVGSGVTVLTEELAHYQGAASVTTSRKSKFLRSLGAGATAVPGGFVVSVGGATPD
jgi:membrane-associated phospholipid phosphatase